MHKDLETRRLVLLMTYRRYLAADRDWTVAQREMRAWFPPQGRPDCAAIGNPGSPVRRIYERRERAILQLETARQMLDEAKRRLAARSLAAAASPRVAVFIQGPVVRDE